MFTTEARGKPLKGWMGEGVKGKSLSIDNTQRPNYPTTQKGFPVHPFTPSPLQGFCLRGAIAAVLRFE
jgi:hypothetical protein